MCPGTSQAECFPPPFFAEIPSGAWIEWVLKGEAGRVEGKKQNVTGTQRSVIFWNRLSLEVTRMSPTRGCCEGSRLGRAWVLQCRGEFSVGRQPGGDVGMCLFCPWPLGLRRTRFCASSCAWCWWKCLCHYSDRSAHYKLFAYFRIASC